MQSERVKRSSWAGQNGTKPDLVVERVDKPDRIRRRSEACTQLQQEQAGAGEYRQTATMATISAILFQLPQVSCAVVCQRVLPVTNLFLPLSLLSPILIYFAHGADQGAAERASVQAAPPRVQQC